MGKREQFNKEMSSLDDALKEAERIAAEMDMFMMEEEQKIEEDFKAKRKEEEHKWKAETAPSSFPMPSEPALPRQHIETNIDSSDEEEKSMSRASTSSSSLRKQPTTLTAQEEQQRWLLEQREKREKYRQEQERLRQ